MALNTNGIYFDNYYIVIKGYLGFDGANNSDKEHSTLKGSETPFIHSI